MVKELGLRLGFFYPRKFNTCNMEKTKRKTVSNYAKIMGVTRQTVYRWIKEKEVKSEIIDGIRFIILT